MNEERPLRKGGWLKATGSAVLDKPLSRHKARDRMSTSLGDCVCLSSRSRSYRTMLQSRQLAIHTLADDQSILARAFAAKGVDRSTICKWSISPRGNAILEACLIVLECRIQDVQQAGDHAIVIVRVEAIEKRSTSSGPLVYHEGRMFALEARAG